MTDAASAAVGEESEEAAGVPGQAFLVGNEPLPDDAHGGRSRPDQDSTDGEDEQSPAQQPSLRAEP